MFRNFKTIRTFYRLSKVRPILIFLMLLTLIVPVLLSIWTPILVSNTITAITVYDFKRAMHQTTIEFGIILISAILYYLYHLLSTKVNRIIITNFQNYIYHNVKNNKDIKSINISILKDISTCASFNKNLIHKFCFFLKALIILGIILYYSYILALAIIVVSIVSFFLLKITDKKIQYKTQELSKYENVSVELFNSICKGESATESYNLEKALKDKYFKYVDENIKTSNSISLYYNINNNFISLILKATVFAATIYLINSVKNTQLTLSIYLILTPYLTSSAENLISFFDIFSEIALMDNILSHFKSLEFISSPELVQPIEIKSYNLYFYNISSVDNTNLKDINIKIDYKNIACFIGDEDSYLTSIFNLITKKEKPKSGCIFLGDKNISDFDNLNLNKYIASVTQEEKFFNISIYENFYLVCPSRNKIFRELKRLNLTELINSFDEKINTILSDNLTRKNNFFLGLARAHLSDAKIINIFKFPENLTKSEKELLKNMLKIISKSSTIICYLNDENFPELFDEIFVIKKLKKFTNILSKNANNNNRN